MLKFSKIISSKSKKIVKHNIEYLGIFPFVEMKISRLIIHLIDIVEMAKVLWYLVARGYSRQ